MRINLRYNTSTGVSSAALNHATVKITVPAQEKKKLQKVSKTTKTLSIQLMNKMNGKAGRLALATKISSCPRNLLSRSASSAS